MGNLFKNIIILGYLISVISTGFASDRYDYLYPNDFLSDSELKEIVKETDRIVSERNIIHENLLKEIKDFKDEFRKDRVSCNKDKVCVEDMHYNLKLNLERIQKKIRDLPNFTQIKKEKLKDILIASIGANILFKIKQYFDEKEKKGDLVYNTNMDFSRARDMQEIADLLKEKNLHQQMIPKATTYIDFYYETMSYQKNIRLIIFGLNYLSYNELSTIIHYPLQYNIFSSNQTVKKLVDELFSYKSNTNFDLNQKIGFLREGLGILYRNDSVFF